MRITAVNNNTNYQTNFEGIKEGKKFRRSANNLIPLLKKASGFDYRSHNGNAPSLRDRLFNAIYSQARAIGKENVTPEDKRLFEKLKNEYKFYEEQDDYMDAMMGGGGHYVDRTVDLSI